MTRNSGRLTLAGLLALAVAAVSASPAQLAAAPRKSRSRKTLSDMISRFLQGNKGQHRKMTAGVAAVRGGNMLDKGEDLDQRLLDRAHTLAQEIAAKWGLEVSVERMRVSEPAQMAPAIQAVIDKAAQDLELKTHRMNSGAGHDAQVMAKVTEAGMIFVPSRQGRSHSPAEFTEWEQIENGANVLLHTLLQLAEAS